MVIPAARRQQLDRFTAQAVFKLTARGHRPDRDGACRQCGLQAPCPEINNLFAPVLRSYYGLAEPWRWRYRRFFWFF